MAPYSFYKQRAHQCRWNEGKGSTFHGVCGCAISSACILNCLARAKSNSSAGWTPAILSLSAQFLQFSRLFPAATMPEATSSSTGKVHHNHSSRSVRALEKWALIIERLLRRLRLRINHAGSRVRSAAIVRVLDATIGRKFDGAGAKTALAREEKGTGMALQRIFSCHRSDETEDSLA